MESDQFMNLTVHRSDADGWQRSGWRDQYLDDKLGLSLALAGASLLLYGAYSARRGTPASRWWGVSGASLLSCAAARFGRRQMASAYLSGDDSATGDMVTLESVDSFPASDAPSSNATTASPQPLAGRDHIR